MTPAPKRFSLLELCDAAGLSAREVAARIGVTASAVYLWSKRERRPESGLIPRLRRVLQISEADLEDVLASPRKIGAPRKR